MQEHSTLVSLSRSAGRGRVVVPGERLVRPKGVVEVVTEVMGPYLGRSTGRSFAQSCNTMVGVVVEEVPTTAAPVAVAPTRVIRERGASLAFAAAPHLVAEEVMGAAVSAAAATVGPLASP